MLRLLGGRLLQGAFVMLAVGAIAFCLFRFVGDPVSMMVSVEDTPEIREQLRKDLGLDQGPAVQFARYLERLAHLDFGMSYRSREPVASMIAARFPATLELVFCATLFAVFVGIPLGVVAALNRGNWLSRLIETVSLIGISMPTFMTGTLLILLFSVTWRVLPSFGRGETVAIGGWTTGFLTTSGLLSLIMPSITLGLFQMTLLMRLVQGEMVEVLRADFIRFARARGLPDRIVHFRHALRNCLVPVVTVAGMQLGSLIAFAIVTETVFQWPGMGLLFVQSISNVDVPVMAAYLIVVAFVFVTINLIVDLLYYVIDPRLRTSVASAGGRPA